MVEDPYLVEHLAHFGIKTTNMEKTEKSMIELELDLNQRIGEWSILTESASKLIPISGPGFTGMKNLGNSCYLNSVMQVINISYYFNRSLILKSPAYITFTYFYLCLFMFIIINYNFKNYHNYFSLCRCI